MLTLNPYNRQAWFFFLFLEEFLFFLSHNIVFVICAELMRYFSGGGGQVILVCTCTHEGSSDGETRCVDENLPRGKTLYFFYHFECKRKEMKSENKQSHNLIFFETKKNSFQLGANDDYILELICRLKGGAVAPFAPPYCTGLTSDMAVFGRLKVVENMQP